MTEGIYFLYHSFHSCHSPHFRGELRYADFMHVVAFTAPPQQIHMEEPVTLAINRRQSNREVNSQVIPRYILTPKNEVRAALTESSGVWNGSLCFHTRKLMRRGVSFFEVAECRGHGVHGSGTADTTL